MNEEAQTDRVNTIRKKKRTIDWIEHRQHVGIVVENKFDKKENCPAYGKACNECRQRNHFADCCCYQRHGGDNKKDRQPYRKQDSTPRRIKRVETESDKSLEDEEFIRKMTDKK